MTRAERILVLGGGGFMGRALCSRLLERGHEVHALMRGALLDAPERVVVHGGGIENIGPLQPLLQHIDAIVHVASATTPNLSRTTPSLEADLNIAPTLALLEELQRHPHIRLVYLSSGGTVYGNPGPASATEAAALRPLSYYGAGKLAIEEFLRCFQHLSGNRVSILRPSNLYGPGQPRYQGFAVVRTMLQHLNDGTTMTIWGDGSAVRDFIHIDDVVSAIECVLVDADASGTFNVGSGIGHSVDDLKAIAEHVSGRPLMVRYEPSRNMDVKRIVLDSSAMQERFGWRAHIPLAAGIKGTWNWLRAQQGPAHGG